MFDDVRNEEQSQSSILLYSDSKLSTKSFIKHVVSSKIRMPVYIRFSLTVGFNDQAY